MTRERVQTRKTPLPVPTIHGTGYTRSRWRLDVRLGKPLRRCLNRIWHPYWTRSFDWPVMTPTTGPFIDDEVAQ